MKTVNKEKHMVALDFVVADHRFTLLFAEDGENYKELLPSYGPFCVGESQLPLLFSMLIRLGKRESSMEGKELGQFDCNGINYGVYELADGYKMVIGSLNDGVSCVLYTNRDFSECEAWLEGELSQRAFGLNNALMIAFAFAGAYRKTLLVHASVIRNGDKGYLFLGKSGTGKSTHSRLWIKYVEGSDLLNDDNPAIRIMDGKAYVYGTPWSGKTPCYRNLCVEAGAFLRLRQAPGNVIWRETPIKAFASVLSSCSTMIWDRPSYDAICQTVEDVIKIVPAYHLDCLPDQAAAELSFATIAR